jgi:hypothetical protein
MGQSHGPRIPRTWRLQAFSYGGTSRHLCTDKDHRMRLTSDRSSPRPVYRSFRKCCALCVATSLRGMNSATPTMAVVLSVNLLMCWDMKVVSLLHVYVPITDNKVDYFLQCFHFFLWRLKRITLYIVAYLLHAWAAEPQKQPLLSNTRTQQ